MPFAPRTNRSPDTPSVSGEDKCKCGKRAVQTIEGRVEIFGKLVPVKFRVCEDHKTVFEGAKYSIVTVGGKS